MMNPIEGVFPVLPTPFTDSGECDLAGLGRVIDYAVDAGVNGLVFPGLASEYDVLSLDEREMLIGFVGEAIDGRVSFVVGASSDALADSERLAAVGARAGARAAMVMTPKAIGNDSAALADFYARLGQRAELPIMLQNAPQPMGLGLAVDQLRQVVSAAGAVRWVKEECMPCGQRISAILADRPANLVGVFGGAGGRYILDELGRGAVGTMPACETPEAHVALMAAYRAGALDEARDIYEAMLPILLMQAVFRWRLTKEVLRHRGLIASAYTRATGPELDDCDRAELLRILDRMDVRLQR